jgi:VIT1/CCC1 family predicted Fe2+/Mn2+ transporter
MRRLLAIGIAWCALVALASPGFAQVEDVTSERPPGEGPTRVEVAFYFIDLMKVIDTDEAFEADVFILASWKDPRLAGERIRVVPADAVWTPNVLVFNQRDISTDLPERVEIQPDGTVFYRQRLTGTFASRLDLNRFPLDSQTLEIRLVVYGNGRDEVLLVDSTAIPTSRSAQLAINDWEIGELETEAGVYSPIPGALSLSSLTVRVQARRLIGYYLVQLLVPLLIIVGMSWVVFWIDPGVIPARMSVGVTSVLTLVAYRFMVGGLVPKLPYLTRMDYLLLGATVLVAAALLIVVTGTYLTSQDRRELALRLNRSARSVFPILFLLLLIWVAVAG